MNPEELKALASEIGVKNAANMKNMFDAARAEDEKTAVELQAKLMNELGAESPHIKAMQTQLDAISTAQKTARAENVAIKSFRQSLADQEVAKKLADLRATGSATSKLTLEVPLNLKVANMTNTNNLSSGLPKYDWIPGVSKTQDEAPFLSNLIQKFATTSNTIYYINRTARTTAAAAVTPGNALPQTDYTYAGATAAVLDYGAYTKIHQNMLDDNDFVAGQLDAELPWDVMHVFDAAIMTGILSGATAFAAPAAYANKIVEANNYDVIRAAINQARRNNCYPDAVFVHTDDYAMMEMTKTSTGEYVTPLFFQAQGIRISNVPVYPNNTITSGTYVVCSLNRTYLAMRQNLVMEFGLDDTDFTLRMVTARAYVRGVYVKSTQAALGFVSSTFDDAKTALNL